MAAVALKYGVYFIQNAGTKTVMELPGGSTTNGTKIIGHTQRPLSDALVPSQLWVVSPVAGRDNTYRIENANSRTFMDLTASNVVSGTPIIGYQATNNPNQAWIITRSTNSDITAYVIANKATGTFADLLNGGSADGTAVNGWAGEGPTTANMHQLWNFVRA